MANESRLKKLGKLAAKVFVPGTQIIPFIMKNGNGPNHKDHTDGMQAFESIAYGVNLAVVSSIEITRLGLYAIAAYQLLK